MSTIHSTVDAAPMPECSLSLKTVTVVTSALTASLLAVRECPILIRKYSSSPHIKVVPSKYLEEGAGEEKRSLFDVFLSIYQ